MKTNCANQLIYVANLLFIIINVVYGFFMLEFSNKIDFGILWQKWFGIRILQ